MNRPTRQTTAGRVYLDLQTRARREERPTDELLVLYILERFIFRLSRSEHRQRLVLKGGMLLAAFNERRPTADVDLLARTLENDAETIATVVRAVVAVEVDDGVEFEAEKVRSQVIREEHAYSGVRLTMPARVARARHVLRVDVSVGDPVTPAPVEVQYPSLLNDPFPVVGYPLETVLAEKIVTMIERGETTTRERDFADVYVLTRRHSISAETLAAAISATARHRDCELRPLKSVLGQLAVHRQTDWSRFIGRAGLGGDVPASYAVVIEAVVEFADAILRGHAATGAIEWDASSASWRAR